MIDEKPVASEILVRWWQKTAAGIQTQAVPQTEIVQLETRYDLAFPPSFRQYLGHASPVTDPSWDNELTNWWPCSSFKSVAEDYGHDIAPEMAVYRQKLILFADYSIWCWGWAINCAVGSDYGKIAVIGGSERFVADSFDEFVLRYIDDWITLSPSQRHAGF